MITNVRIGERDVAIDDRLWGDDPPGTPQPVRLAFAAAHVVMRDGYDTLDHSLDAPGQPAEIAEWIDWPATMNARRWLASHGFGIAEAMDTAQRFMLGWPGASRLIDECSRLDVAFVAGASSDHLDSVDSPDQLIEAVVHQCDTIAHAGGVPVILPMPKLVEWNTDADGYVRIYTSIVRRHCGPVILHWLGPMFMASLEGYFPDNSFQRILTAEPRLIRGAKLSMLDADLERRLRRDMLEHNQVMLTGDDFNFSSLIEGDGPPRRTIAIRSWPVPLGDFSHALLGILDAIAFPASRALRDLARGDVDSYRRIMTPCEALSRVIFEEPTTHYKAAIAFLAWLDGRQDNAMLVNRQETARSQDHFERVVVAAAAAGVFEHADVVARRLQEWSAGRTSA